jgi:hypothetical protein
MRKTRRFNQDGWLDVLSFRCRGGQKSRRGRRPDILTAARADAVLFLNQALPSRESVRTPLLGANPSWRAARAIPSAGRRPRHDAAALRYRPEPNPPLNEVMNRRPARQRTRHLRSYASRQLLQIQWRLARQHPNQGYPQRPALRRCHRCSGPRLRQRPALRCSRQGSAACRFRQGSEVRHQDCLRPNRCRQFPDCHKQRRRDLRAPYRSNQGRE